MGQEEAGFDESEEIEQEIESEPEEDESEPSLDDEIEPGESDDENDSESESESDDEDDGDSESDEQEDDEDSDEIYLSFGEEEPVEREDSPPLRQLRKEFSRIKKENRDLKRQQREREQQQSSPSVEDVGPEPTLESCDWDEAVFKQKLLEHQKAVDKIESEKQQQREKQQADEEAWNRKLERYESQRSRIANEDYEMVEDLVNQKLSPAQRSLIIHSSENPSAVFFALGKSPEELERIAKIQDDPIAFAFEVGLFQSKKEAKVVKKGKKAPPPEKRVRGSAPRPQAGDSKLDRLRAKAERTGDYTEVYRYKQSLSSKK